MKFSVLMSIYKKEEPRYFNRAMQSIWDEQTVKPDEIILVQDGPLTDGLYKAIDEWKVKIGESFKTIPLEKNVGLAKALNIGLNYCTYELIARMDTDDISLPNRFEKQLRVFEEKDIDVCGGLIKEFNMDTQEKKIIHYPENNSEILKAMKKRNSMAHVTTCFHKRYFQKAGLYDTSKLNEDYALWIEGFINECKFYNLQEVLVMVRTNNAFFDRRRNIKRAIEVMQLKIKVTKYFNLGLSGYMFAIAHLILFMSPSFIKRLVYKNFR